MKKIYLILFLLLFCSFQPLLAHKEWVHQYIVNQAYQLLRDELGHEIPKLRHFAGVDINGSGTYIWGQQDNAPTWQRDYSMVVGAWLEDNEDIVYNSDYVLGVFNQSMSSTHFWDADAGDDQTINIHPNALNAPNAYHKADNYSGLLSHIGTLRHTIEIKDACQTLHRNFWGNDTWVSCASRFIQYNSITDLIINQKYRLISDKPMGYFWGSRIYNAEITMSNNSLVRANDNPEFWGYQLMGRIMHLLGDMSVPAHTHVVRHNCQAVWKVDILLLSDRGDEYELDMGNDRIGSPNDHCNDPRDFYGSNAINANRWDAKSARQQGGLLWETFSMSFDDALRYLFASTNQLTQHYPSLETHGKITSSGNNDLNNNTSTPFLESKLTIGGSNYLGNPDDVQYDKIDVAPETFNYVIRAVATLMYRYALELGLLNDCQHELYVQNDRLWGIGNYYGSGANSIDFTASLTNSTPSSTPAIIVAGKDLSSFPNHYGTGSVAGDVVVDKSAKVNFASHDEIYLEDGFSVEKGADFHAFINSQLVCTQPVPAPPALAALPFKNGSNRIAEDGYTPVDTTIPSGVVHAVTDSVYIQVVTGATVAISSSGVVTIVSGASVSMSSKTAISAPDELITGHSEGDSVLIFNQNTSLYVTVTMAVIVATTQGNITYTNADVTVSPVGLVVVCTNCSLGRQSEVKELKPLNTQAGCSLGSAYPNPFTDRTVIEYVISTPRFVSLEVTDIFGRRIAELVQKDNHAAGRFTVEFNAKDVPAGVYYYTLRAGEFVETHKMVLSK